MRKWFIACIVSLMISVGAMTASAHLTGAFASYLAIVYDESTIGNLTRELDDTKEEIEQLTPKVEKLEKEFEASQALAIDQLLGYSDVGLDTWYTMMADDEDIVDLLGDQWVMNKAIQHYIDALDELYLLYQDVKIQQQTLQGHSDLLQVIQTNIERRASYLAENEGEELETIANYLDIDWFSEVEEPIIKAMNDDKQFLQENLLSHVKEQNGTYSLSEKVLNEQSKARYFFRADHVYVEFKVNKEHVILIGQILQNKEGTKATLEFEAGYYNGFFLPNESLVEIPSISLDYKTLKTLKGITQPYVKQTNGTLEIKTK